MAADVILTHDEVVELAPAYVLGALERDEEAAVVEHLRTCPEPHEEMAELGSVVPYLADVVPQVEPPAALRSRILAAAAEDLAARPRNQATDPAAPVSSAPAALSSAPAEARSAEAPGTQPAPVTSIDAARRRLRPATIRNWALGIAAVLAIVALGAWNLNLQNQLNDTRAFQEQVASTLALGQQAGSQVAILASTSGSGGPGGLGVMPASGPGQLVMSGLTPTKGNEVYEVWAIAEGQAPVPVGWFTADTSGNGFFDDMPSAVGQTITVAVTLEPQKDPPAPTTPVLAAGPAVVNS